MTCDHRFYDRPKPSEGRGQRFESSRVRQGFCGLRSELSSILQRWRSFDTDLTQWKVKSWVVWDEEGQSGMLKSGLLDNETAEEQIKRLQEGLIEMCDANIALRKQLGAMTAIIVSGQLMNERTNKQLGFLLRK